MGKQGGLRSAHSIHVYTPKCCSLKKGYKWNAVVRQKGYDTLDKPAVCVEIEGGAWFVTADAWPK